MIALVRSLDQYDLATVVVGGLLAMAAAWALGAVPGLWVAVALLGGVAVLFTFARKALAVLAIAVAVGLVIGTYGVHHETPELEEVETVLV